MFNPRYDISPALLEHIKRITILVYELNKLGVPDLVFADLQAEARALSTFASTSIEGNPLPLTDVKRLLKARPAHVRQSEQEVLNYNQVLSSLSEDLNQPLTLDLLLDIHQGVTVGLLPAHQSGRFRQEPVIGYDPRTKEVAYLPPDHPDVPDLMKELLAYVRENRPTLDPLLLAGLFHKQFVVIHPFVDGNGRTTRLATKLLLAGMGINTFNLLSFENYDNLNVSRYFEQVGITGNYYDLVDGLDFTSWLEYFAEGILDELLRVQKIIEQRQATPDTRLEEHHWLILQTIDKQGFINDRDYSKLTDRAKATRTLDFKKLLKLGLIVREGRGRGTYYRRP